MQGRVHDIDYGTRPCAELSHNTGNFINITYKKTFILIAVRLKLH